jgi:hypothetical protein
VEPGNAGLTVTLEATFNTTFGVILAPNALEPIIVIGEACDGNEKSSFYCDVDNLIFQLDYKQGGEDPVTVNVSVGQRQGNESVTNVLERAFNTSSSNLAYVQTQGSNLIVVRFDKSLGSIYLKVPKNCNNIETLATTQINVFECANEKDIPTSYPNSYGLEDFKKSKIPFQIAVGYNAITANFIVTGVSSFIELYQSSCLLTPPSTWLLLH